MLLKDWDFSPDRKIRVGFAQFCKHMALISQQLARQEGVKGAQSYERCFTELEQRVSDVQDGLHTSQSELVALKTAIALHTDRLEDLENRSRRSNLQFVGLPETLDEKELPMMLKAWLTQELNISQAREPWQVKCTESNPYKPRGKYLYNESYGHQGNTEYPVLFARNPCTFSPGILTHEREAAAAQSSDGESPRGTATKRKRNGALPHHERKGHSSSAVKSCSWLHVRPAAGKGERGGRAPASRRPGPGKGLLSGRRGTEALPPPHAHPRQRRAASFPLSSPPPPPPQPRRDVAVRGPHVTAARRRTYAQPARQTLRPARADMFVVAAAVKDSQPSKLMPLTANVFCIKNCCKIKERQPYPKKLKQDEIKRTRHPFYACSFIPRIVLSLMYII
ncbi:uncharacterized protein LOC115076492 [Rhinatrema bivittatum]|uniref:uncharacterized protein LOC115076492 n=1 Tax=Rhinatrema bivittatum TaxID=194408 RepID=UPI001129A2FB|nr:uncharacterized protein LOC115076492 [Rhinatrema bivittatum]